MKQANRTMVLLIGLLYIAALSGCAVKEGTVYQKDGRLYGKPAGLFGEQWHDYYLRGLSYSDGGYWDDATADFIEALRGRDKDQRRARTYGLHFIDYFPNRELGIAYFYKGDYEKAIQSLENSLASSESARAKFYLNKARQSWLRKTQLDTSAPALSVQFPPPRYVTNNFSITIKGTARDNFFVSSLIINNKPSALELASRDINFAEEVPLQPGENLITIQARDLTDRTSPPIVLRVEIDRQGPLAFFNGIREQDGSLRVSGVLYDASEVAKISINQKNIALRTGKLVKINELFERVRLQPGEQVSFVAEDRVGNRTAGNISIAAAGRQLTQSSPVLLAYLTRADYFSAHPSIPEIQLSPSGAPGAVYQSQIPAVDFRSLRHNQTVFIDSLFVECAAFAPAGIQALTLNGESFFPRQQDESFAAFIAEMAQRRQTPLSFSKLSKLQEGPNTITVGLVDKAGAEVKKTITIIRKIPIARQIGSRLSVVVYPFKEQKQQVPLTDYVQTFLTHSFVNQKRFYILERQELEKILQEQQMTQEAVFDQKTAVKLGRMMVAETIILGDILASEKSVEVIARMVDTETSVILAEKDVYWEGPVRAGFREILDGLALKFKQQFPLCEGVIIAKNPKEVQFNLGTAHAICKGMRFLAFQEGSSASNAGTFGNNTEILGLLSASDIHDSYSSGTILKKFASRDIEVRDGVISK
jgi:tetratricopeptide (TPR) repeat protein